MMTHGGTSLLGRPALFLAAAAMLVACSSTPDATEPPLYADPPRADGSATPTSGEAGPKKSADLAKGEELVQAGQYADAMPHLKKALDANPKDPQAAFYLALSIEQTNGDKKEAEKLYKQALAFDPKLAEAAQNLAAFYLADPPRPDDAIAVLDKALAHSPTDAKLLVNLGYAYQLKKDYERAKKAYDKALTIEDTPDLRFAYGTMLFESKQAEAAVPHLLKAAEKMGEDPAALATIARMLGPGKAFNDCVRLLDKAITLKADVAEFYVRRGVCKHELKQEKEASKDFEQAIKIDAKYQPAHYYLGLSLLKLGKKTQARDALKKAMDLGPDTPVGKMARQKRDEVRP